MDESVKLPTHPHPLKPSKASDLYCYMCACSLGDYEVDGYECKTCNMDYHRGCAESPLEINHPYHPRHCLTLRPLDRDMRKASIKCNWCRQKLKGLVYHCPICKFFLHLRCAKDQPALHVDHPKCHEHPLTLLPRPLPFTCNACGLSGASSLPYICHNQCDFMVHRDCIDLPRVIRISRHQHRLSRVSSLSREEWSCGVCRKAVDNNFGAYSCTKGCHYVVHSKCATRDDVWDGKELEGEPEEPEEDVEPFEVIDEERIRHFSHEHHILKLNKDEGCGFDGSEHCHACALPIRIQFGNLYRCTQSDCGFILHETCASLPRKIWFILHPHRLTLHTSATDCNVCNVCYRKRSGFFYKCFEDKCHFEVDVRCASVSEPFNHKGHSHPLFSTSLSLDYETCFGCKDKNSQKKMQCIECDFV